MKICLKSCWYLVPTLTIAALVAPAGAQVIPPAAKTAADATPHRKAIDDYVKAQVKKITSGKADQQVSGRNGLETESVAAAGASSSYLTIYADVVNANLLPLAADKNVSNRLNAAIVNSKVAAKDPNPALADATTKFVNDPVEAISIWGLKAAKSILVPTLQANNPAAAPLMASISNAVKRFPMSGAIAEEAYRAIGVDRGVGVPNSVVQPVIPDMLNIMHARIAGYQRALPGLPSADNQGVSFVSLKAWGLLTPAQQKEVVQLLSDLVSAQGQHIENMPGATRSELLESIRVSGGAFQVIGGTIKDPKIVEAGKNLSSSGVATPGSEILERTKAIYPALIANPRFKDLKEPPQVDTTHDAVEEEPAKADAAAKPAAASTAKESTDDAVDASAQEPAPGAVAAPKTAAKAPARAGKPAAGKSTGLPTE